MTVPTVPGDVVWVSFPVQRGTEQAGRRPALIVQTDDWVLLPTVVGIPITSNQRALRFPATLALAPTAGNGLVVPSVLLVFQLRAIDKVRIERRVGRIDDATLSAVWCLIDRLLGRRRL